MGGGGNSSLGVPGLMSSMGRGVALSPDLAAS